jgi:hypothetical protein
MRSGSKELLLCAYVREQGRQYSRNRIKFTCVLHVHVRAMLRVLSLCMHYQGCGYIAQEVWGGEGGRGVRCKSGFLQP